MHRFAWCLGLLLLPICSWAYESAAPPFITVDVVWEPPGKDPITVNGALHFSDIPVRDPVTGAVRGFGARAHFQGIKWFVPKEPGDIWMTRVKDAKEPTTFLVHAYQPEFQAILAFDKIEVFRSTESVLADAKAKMVAGLTDQPSTAGSSKVLKKLGEKTGLTSESDEDEEAKAIALDERSEKDPTRSPIRLALDHVVPFKEIPLVEVTKITFYTAANSIPRDRTHGRFVEYSNQAIGDEGRVQVVASTYFGGPGNEVFHYAAFRSDFSILMASHLREHDFLDAKLIRVIGTDPPADAYPPVDVKDRRGRTYTDYPRNTLVFIHYAKDLAAIAGVHRFPWGAGTSINICQNDSDGLLVSGRAGVHFDTWAKDLKCPVKVIENPAAVAAAEKAKQPLPQDGFVIQLDKDFRPVWLVRFKHLITKAFLLNNGKVLTLPQDQILRYILSDGTVEQGAKVEAGGQGMTVDPRNGDMYFYGSYRSATGLEPYVCPFLHKANADGSLAWTGYGWGGPLAGVDQLRLVSDSSIKMVQVKPNGSLAISAWSDGGNTVLARQPYDIRKEVPTAGFAGSLWGASGQTVRIVNLIRMDGDTMEVKSRSNFSAYSPTSNIPLITNVYSVHETDSGDVAITGSCGPGLIETHDAWITPWYIRSRLDEDAEGSRGIFFALFKPDFSTLRMSTRVPNFSGLQVTGRGDKLLIYSCATKKFDDSPSGKQASSALVVKAVQPVFGGGLDGMVIMVDTHGSPRPPIIPPRKSDKPTKNEKKDKP